MISIIIPTYNESSNILAIYEKVSGHLDGKRDYEIIFIDDGSTDDTLKEIKEISKANENIQYISFSRNFGHQKALKAGIDYAQGECVISMDGDLQHPPKLLMEMIENWENGYDIVYTIRKETRDTPFLKKMTSRLFYKFLNMLSDVEIPLGAADFRLLDKKVVRSLRKFKENWLFIRGIVSWLGFRQKGLEYIVQPRHSGSSKYSIIRMISFALEGITSFSILPLRVSTFVGIFISFFGFFYAIYALYVRFFSDTAVPGWTSILISVLILGGIQLISLGVIGEYLGKMFIEAKDRPSYVIQEKSF